MALPGWPVDELPLMSKTQLFQYFCEYAKYQPDAPQLTAYAIRFGSRTLFSHDTHDLWEQFQRAVKNYKRRTTPPQTWKEPRHGTTTGSKRKGLPG